ncbi:hypothetical protein VP03_26930 [Sinorhizobium meliloti]|uniref:class I SAM-dependent methyltransferase n=1 Tax=Rhizobium meliloti TaxID=382 RepID=UPI0006145C78|nr:class I SAM-dependent methyltransferase [Sinorhizobium meliloti]KKA10860.1 hypothetical protein VP03_26930 [Sinorhizobium meliloti]
MPKEATKPAINWGDFTSNAKEYGERPPYSSVVLAMLAGTVTSSFGNVCIAELGAGTGNLLRSFDSDDVRGYAVEPNPAMQAVAHQLAPHDSRFEWITGTAEASGLPDNSVNWVLLGNAYQFVDPPKMFQEAHRILHKNGFLTIIWNVRDFKRDVLQREIEEMVKGEVADLKRTGTSVVEIMDIMDTKGLFKNVSYVEASHDHYFTPERFLDTWKAGCDVPSQVTEEGWNAILEKTAQMIPRDESIRTNWITRAWTLQAS